MMPEQENVPMDGKKMTPLPLEPRTMLEAVNALTRANIRSAEITASLVVEVKEDQRLRTDKIHELQLQSRRIRKMMVAVVIMCTMLLAAITYSIYATTQSRGLRNEQFKQSVKNQQRIEDIAHTAGGCAITAKGDVSIYDACMAANGFPK